MFYFYIIIFTASCALLFWSGSRLTSALMKMARLLSWREFVLAFFVMAFAGTAPNLFIGFQSVVHQIPQLSLGDVVGGNIIDLTLAVALAMLIGRAALPARSRMVQTSTLFTTGIAFLPLLLIIDGHLGRGDGLVLLLGFGLYVFWLFSKQERFRKVYPETEVSVLKYSRVFFKSLAIILLSLLLLLIAAEGVVISARYFALALNLPLALVAILIVGVGNALPETYFAVASAKKGQNWMILGNLMGSVIVPSTLVLGLVALLSPFRVSHLPLFLAARVFLGLAAVLFLIVLRTGQRITKKEAFLLLGLFLAFVATIIALS